MVQFADNSDDNIKPLPEDNDPPFSPPSPPVDDDDDDMPDKLDDTHPATDTNIQPEEVYEEGLSGAAEVKEPSEKEATGNYSPEEDKSAST